MAFADFDDSNKQKNKSKNMSSKNKKNGAKSENSENNGTTSEIVSSASQETTAFVLESGIPIPSPLRTKHKYPFKIMGPGQSFPIPKKTNVAGVQVAYWKKKLLGTDYSVRALATKEIEELKVSEIGKMYGFTSDVTVGSRIWRTDGVVEVVK